jgi:excisionase family DNA binding protein
MRATYDRCADSLAIVLADEEVEETRNIAPGVEVDYGSSGRVVAIEVLNASRKYDVEHIGLESPDPYLSLAEAGELVGISPTTLRHQIARGILPGTKIGRNWAVHQRDLFKYANERSKKAAGARSGQ